MNRSHARSLIERAHGPVLAVTTYLGDFAQEIQHAQEAVDRSVVMDASALVVACELPDYWSAFHVVFENIVVVDATAFDCLTACADVRQAPGSVSTLIFGTEGQRPRAARPSDEDTAALHKRANALEQLIGRVETFTDPDSAVSLIGPDADRLGVRVITTCLERGATLWSDDVALRGYARAADCPVFGMVALLHVLQESGQHVGDLRRAVVQLARTAVADLVLDSGELAELAADCQGMPGPRSCEATTAWVTAACRGIMGCVIDTDRLGTIVRSFVTVVAEHQGSSDSERAHLKETADRLVQEETSRRDAIANVVAILGPRS